jgi:hypothetical protein
LCYDEFTLAGKGVEVLLELIIYINHEYLISRWMGTENLLKGERQHKQILLCLSDPFWIANIRPASREVILKPTYIILIVTLIFI